MPRCCSGTVFCFRGKKKTQLLLRNGFLFSEKKTNTAPLLTPPKKNSRFRARTIVLVAPKYPLQQSSFDNRARIRTGSVNGTHQKIYGRAEFPHKTSNRMGKLVDRGKRQMPCNEIRRELLSLGRSIGCICKEVLDANAYIGACTTALFKLLNVADRARIDLEEVVRSKLALDKEGSKNPTRRASETDAEAVQRLSPPERLSAEFASEFGRTKLDEDFTKWVTKLHEANHEPSSYLRTGRLHYSQQKALNLLFELSLALGVFVKTANRDYIDVADFGKFLHAMVSMVLDVVDLYGAVNDGKFGSLNEDLATDRRLHNNAPKRFLGEPFPEDPTQPRSIGS